MRRLFVLLLLLLSAVPAFAQFGGLDSTPKVSILEAPVHARRGDQVEGTIVARIEEGWHVNSHEPTEEFSIPTVVALDGAELVGARYPEHKMMAFEFTGGKELAVYDGTIRIPYTAKLAGGKTAYRAIVKYQACSDKICLPPNEASIGVDASKIVAAAGPAPAGAAPVTTSRTSDVPQDRLARTFAASGMPLTLAVLFVLGMALNLTPCVFPLIPITLGFFAMQSDGRRSRRFALSAMYVLGLVITYSTLGVVASIGGKMFGAVLQLPSVLIGFALLMLVLSSSMFGAFEIQPPRWIANRSQGRAGMLGAMSMGLVIGIVAAPCVGPVVISLVTLVAQIGKPMTGFVMFAALAFGLGFPYLVMLNALPRPGEWMVTVKKAMGFVLIAMAFYFLRPLTGDTVFNYGVAAALIIGAIFLLVKRTEGAKALRYALAVLLLAGGVWFAIPHRGVDVEWEAYNAGTLAAAKAANKPVVVDFTADWCVPCKELESQTFSHPTVAAELNRFARVKADVTQTNAEAASLMKTYSVVGPPTVIFLDPNGNELRDLRLTGFEKPEAFLKRLQSVR